MPKKKTTHPALLTWSQNPVVVKQNRSLESMRRPKMSRSNETINDSSSPHCESKSPTDFCFRSETSAMRPKTCGEKRYTPQLQMSLTKVSGFSA